MKWGYRKTHTWLLVSPCIDGHKSKIKKKKKRNEKFLKRTRKKKKKAMNLKWTFTLSLKINNLSFKSLVSFFLLSERTGLHYSIQTSSTFSSLHLHHSQLLVIHWGNRSNKKGPCMFSSLDILTSLDLCAHLGPSLYGWNVPTPSEAKLLFSFLFFSFPFWIPSPVICLTSYYHLCNHLLFC